MNREFIDSGIEWIGHIPPTWKMIPNKYLFIEHCKKVGDNWKNYQLLSLTTKGIKEKDINSSGGKVPESYDNYQIVTPGDMVFCLFDLDVSAVFSGLSNLNGMITSAYNVCSVNNRLICESYANYWFQYVFSNRYYKIYSKNIRYTVTSDNFGLIKSPCPPINEQKCIGNYLDRKISQIDKLIANQEKQIEKLNEYKKSKITEILQTNNKQGERLKFYLSEQMMYGANESGYAYKDGYVRYIRITDINDDGELKNNDDNQYLPLEKAKPYLLEEGDILFARSGGTVGKSFIYKSNNELSAFAGYLIKAKCDKTKLLPEYLYFYTQSSKYDAWKNMIFIQATIQNIGANKYSNMPICVPSVEMQKVIIYEIIQLNMKFDVLFKLKQQKIEKLQEYKKSLIYEYVTGKKQVA